MLYRVIEDENHNLVTEALAGTPLVAFDDTLDDTSENAVQNKVITEALDTKLTKPDGVLVCWPNNTLLKWDETSEELAPIATPTADGQALTASLTPQTVTVYSTGGGTFYDVNFQTVSEPSGTAGIPTQVGDFFEYNGTWYKKDGADYYEVTSFTDAGTLVSDAALITELDGHTFLTYSSVVYTQATSDVSYTWDTIGLGCKWTSSDTYACIETCDACSLAHLDGNGVSLGYGNIYAKVCCDCIDVKGCTAVINVGTNSVAIGANATTAACSTAIGYCACASNGSVALGNGATATCGIDIKDANAAEVCISNNRITIGHCINSTDECGFIAGNNINVCADLSNTVIGSNISFGCTLSGAGNTIIGYGHELVNNVYSDLTVIGSCIDECGLDFKGCINDRDVILGTADSAFQLCASNGYLYSAGGSCLMTGRILNDATELPATNCSLILYYAP